MVSLLYGAQIPPTRILQFVQPVEKRFIKLLAKPNLASQCPNVARPSLAPSFRPCRPELAIHAWRGAANHHPIWSICLSVSKLCFHQDGRCHSARWARRGF